MAKTPNGLLLAFLALLSILSFQSVSAQERLRIAWSGSSPAHTPIWVVEEKNLLKKYGIDGEIISITASSIAVQVLLAGEVDVIIGSVANLTSRLAGADTVMLGIAASAAVGVIFGLLPSRRAASLNPIDALRHE